MKEQQEVIEDFYKRPIKPSANTSEPAVWFQNVWVLKSLEGGLEETNIARKFKCRPGLNILWSKPEQFDENTGLYGDGVSGHSTGKTLFCRILRCLLGEDELGADDIKTRLKDSLGALWAVAKIRVNENSWIVGRPLTEGLGSSFAVKSEDVEGTLNAQERDSYRFFEDELNNTQAEDIKELVHDKPWLHLLECLTRDQEARFSSMVKWRDASAGSTGFQMTNQARHSLLRLIIGALDPKEFKLREQVSGYEKSLDAGHESFIFAKADAASKTEAASTHLQGIDDYDLDLENLEVAITKIESSIEVREDAIKNQAEFGRTAETNNAEKKFKEADEKLSDTKNRITQLKEIIPGRERELEAKTETVQRVLTSEHKDPKRAAEDYCPHTRIQAINNKCLVPTTADAESLKELAQLQAEEKNIEADIKKLKKEQNELNVELPKATKLQGKLSADFEKQKKSDLGKLAKQLQILPQLRSLKTAITNAQESSHILAKELKSREGSEEFIKKSKDAIKIFREDQNSSLHYISDIVSDIIRALLGKEVQGKLIINESGLAVTAANEASLSGAALANIKTLAFDLAMVVQGVEGKSKHPRFLIHDGPREGDMARVVYERFFLYIQKIEDAFKAEDPNFQYFVTTTTPPPEKMRGDNSEYLICSPLSGESEDTKLLGSSF